MRLFFLLVIASPCFSQPADPRALLNEVAATAANATGWQVEGTMEEKTGGETYTTEFRLSTGTDHRIRFEQPDGYAPGLILCDSASTVLYSSVLNRYHKMDYQPSICSPLIGDWINLPTSLKDPKTAGERAMVGSAAKCRLIRGTSEPELPTFGRFTTTVCIDTARKAVVWEKFEGRFTSRAYTFRRVETDAHLPDSLFVFEPPQQSVSSPWQVPCPYRFGAPQIARLPGIVMPKLRTKEDPDFSGVPRNQRVQGAVTLYLVIDEHGLPIDLEVFHSLSPVMDIAAAHAVRQWRFTPAMKDGIPVPLASMVEVNYRQL